MMNIQRFRSKSETINLTGLHSFPKFITHLKDLLGFSSPGLYSSIVFDLINFKIFSRCNFVLLVRRRFLQYFNNFFCIGKR